METLVVKLLTTMTLATMAQVITGQGLVGDWVDPTGSAPIIAGLQTLVGPREAVTGARQAHLVRAHPQVSAALSVAKSTRMEDFQELVKPIRFTGSIYACIVAALNFGSLMKYKLCTCNSKSDTVTVKICHITGEVF